MKQQTFRGRTLEDAQKLAAIALGPEFQVVASRKVAKRGLLGLRASDEFEITAEPASPAPTTSHPFPALLRARAEEQSSKVAEDIAAMRAEVRSEVRALRVFLSQANEPDRTERAAVRELESEIALLHELLLDMRADQDQNPPQLLRRMLDNAGIEGLAARALAKRVRERGDSATIPQSLRLSILDLVATAAFPLDKKGRAIIVLIGATGVGKTTTAAKLAAHARLRQRRTVTLISCDVYRVGAVEQLERYAALLQADMRTVKTRHGLEEAIASSTSDVVIVDTAGRLENDEFEASFARLSDLRDFAVRETLLCVPAALREIDARRTAKLAAPCRPTGIVVTKLDETRAPSALVHAPLASKIPLTVLCSGQRVPEDIGTAHPKAVLDLLCPPRQQPGAGSVEP